MLRYIIVTAIKLVAGLCGLLVSLLSFNRERLFFLVLASLLAVSGTSVYKPAWHVRRQPNRVTFYAFRQVIHGMPRNTSELLLHASIQR